MLDVRRDKSGEIEQDFPVSIPGFVPQLPGNPIQVPALSLRTMRGPRLDPFRLPAAGSAFLSSLFENPFFNVFPR